MLRYTKHPVSTMETVYVDAIDGVVDCATLQHRSLSDKIELELPKPSASLVVIQNLHSVAATDITIGNSLAYSLSEPVELPLGAVSYTGPVLDKMLIPAGLKSITVVETPKSGILSRIRLPGGLQKLHIRLTDTFSPVDELHLPPGLLELKVQGEHNCSLEKLNVPPSLTHLDTGTSIQPVDQINTGLGAIRVVSRSTRLLQPITSDTDTQFDKHLMLTSSHPAVTDIHKLLPSLQDVSVILDSATWQTVGNVWCNVLLEGRVRVQGLTLVNNTDRNCMRDFGEVLYRSSRLGRPLCKYLRVVGEVFDHPTCLRVAEAVRKYTGDLLVEVDFMSPFPKCVLHRMASVLGASIRDGDLAYHSNDINVELENNTLSFTKRLTHDERVDSVASDYFSDEDDEETELAELTVGEKPKPIVLYSWVDCGFCKKQDAVVEEMLSDRESDAAKRFEEVVTVKILQKPEEADDPRVQAFPTWVVNGALAPGLKQHSEILEMMSKV